MQFRKLTFLIVVVFMIACAQQEKATKSTKSNESDIPYFSILDEDDSDLQIAEYVVEAFEDRDGNLWFGTMSKGVAKYDGKNLRYYTEADGLCGATISGIAQDKEGNMWFSSHTGLCKYNGAQFETVWESKGIHNIGIGWIGVWQDDDGMIWASSNEGVFQLKDGNFEKFEVPITIKQVDSYSIMPGRMSVRLEDSKGNTWCSFDGAGLVKYDGQNIEHFKKEDGLCSNVITNVLEDDNGNLWISCIQSSSPKLLKDGGLCKYDGKSFIQFPDIAGLNGSDIYTLFKDSKSRIWISVVGVGVYIYEDGQFTLIKETNRMDLTYGMGLQSMLEDRTGNLWFGFSGGLFRWQDGEIINVTKNGPWTN